jgi:hypothetical protein
MIYVIINKTIYYLQHQDVSNSISIDVSDYAIGTIKGTKAMINEGRLYPSGNSLTFLSS